MKRLNEKGFTIVELLTSFMLATVVMIFLFNILISIKDGYLNDKEIADMNTDESFISRIINEDAHNYVLTSEPLISGNKITLNVECVSNACGTEKQIVYTLENRIFKKKINTETKDSHELSDEITMTFPTSYNFKPYNTIKYYRMVFSLDSTLGKKSNVIIYFPYK